MSRRRIIVAVSALLWFAHIGVAALWGATPPGPVFSDIIQLLLGGVLIVAIVDASRRSQGLAHAFWSLAVSAYSVWMVAQALSVYNDVAASVPVAWTANLLFTFWFVPLAMAMFLNPEHETGRLDILMALDFMQGLLVCVAAYLYFFYLPKADSPSELAHSVWFAYFGGYGTVAVAFVLRALVTRFRDVRVLFGRIGGFLALSGGVDLLYYYGPGRILKTGQWFDLLWSALIVVPTLIAVTWEQGEAPEISEEAPRREKLIYTEAFFLIYPLLVLFMSLRIAHEHLGLAAVVVLFSFVSSSARLLITQQRLILAKDALRREAARDSLTSLWNRKAIMGILERELVRAERDQEPVGLIMIDVDHFKAINDSRGHAAGDTVLRIIASGIAAMVRPYDSVGRYGGEEFLIVAPGCGPAETWELAERVRLHVAGCNIMAANAALTVSLSLGVANGMIADEMDRLLQTADAAMYQAKHAGRNRVEPRLERAAGASLSGGQTHHDFWI